VPFYNDFKYLVKALRSCLDNTYPNIEIIIIDDCSSVPLERAALNINLDKYPINIIRNATNHGSGFTRNVGIKHAKGELIAFLDADDVWYPTIIEKQVEIFCANPTVVWVYTDGYYLINNKKVRRLNSSYHGFTKGFPEGSQVNEYHLRGYNYMTFSSNMMKKSALLDVGLFNEHLKVSEDWDLFVRLAEKYPVHAINEPLMYYRVNNAGRHFVNREDYVEVNTKILKDAYERQGLLPERTDKFNLAVAVIYERAGIQRLNAGRNKEAREFLFHPKTKPLAFHFRLICLRTFSFLPNTFYQLALWVYDKVSL